MCDKTRSKAVLLLYTRSSRETVTIFQLRSIKWRIDGSYFCSQFFFQRAIKTGWTLHRDIHFAFLSSSCLSHKVSYIPLNNVSIFSLTFYTTRFKIQLRFRSNAWFEKLQCIHIRATFQCSLYICIAFVCCWFSQCGIIFFRTKGASRGRRFCEFKSKFRPIKNKALIRPRDYFRRETRERM